MSNLNKYGLILRDKSKQQLTFQASHNVFGNDSDSDEDKGKKPVLLQPSVNINRQAKITQEKAITDDPTVYQYDEIYDSMTKEKESKREQKKDEKKPKYIDNLIKSANKRKLENERRVERQVQKEREKEGDEFADKEVFVTSAYKKKLEEIRIEEEKEKREEYLESIGDVTKQRDLGGFYRHLYEQKLGSDNTLKSTQNTKHETSGQETETKTTEPDKAEDVSKNIKQNKQRNYRKRIISSDKKLSEGEIEESENEINFSNLDDIKTFKKSKLSKENIDADSDFSIDESSDEDGNETKDDVSNETEKPDENITNETTNVTTEVQIIAKVLEEPKIKVDIWKKRTVAEVFEQALKRYYERKASRTI
ncbi:nuclear speckle splicing regulatory protein 1 [Bicyclus anynana]|uniref:Nuclear speckle splicing regulatory protein 1 n=1 Tax=Bicyclus anynana TaxID=110368 RepID=A0A6J1NCP9_BICAN|nr:nuclear speckle splicing regulatory protein 1 [Bicyclus anynana]